MPNNEVRQIQDLIQMTAKTMQKELDAHYRTYYKRRMLELLPEEALNMSPSFCEPDAVVEGYNKALRDVRAKIEEEL